MVMYIAIEGPDGAGKSTLAQQIYDHRAELSPHIEVIKPTSCRYSSSPAARRLGNFFGRIIEYG